VKTLLSLVFLGLVIGQASFADATYNCVYKEGDIESPAKFARGEGSVPPDAPVVVLNDKGEARFPKEETPDYSGIVHFGPGGLKGTFACEQYGDLYGDFAAKNTAGPNGWEYSLPEHLTPAVKTFEMQLGLELGDCWRITYECTQQ
jgi:hypothetical protein